jgi:hypothetical protein
MHDAGGLPGLDAVELFGETGGIGGGGEGFLGENHGDLVVAVSVGGGAGEDRDDDVGPVAADDPDDVAEDAVVAPLLHGFGGRLAEAEIDGASEELLGAIDLARGEEFLGANDAEGGALFGADEVLAALAASEREIGGAHVASAGEVGEHAGAFVVGVGGDHEDAAELIEPVDGFEKIGSAGKRLLLGGERSERGDAEGKGQEESTGGH